MPDDDSAPPGRAPSPPGRDACPRGSPAAPGGGSRAPARSRIPALLDEIVRGALNPAYAAAAARRRPGGPQPAARRLRLATALALALAGLLAAAGARQASAQAAEQARVHSALVAEVEAETAGTTALAAKIIEVGEENRVLRELRAAEEAESTELAEQIATLTPACGYAAVRGPGAAVHIADAAAAPQAPDPGPGPDPGPDPGAGAGGGVGGSAPQAGRVLDQDIAEVVNVLWAAGAEAVAVGGIRLTALTAIRSADETILVGFQPLTPPYVIEAVGDAGRLADALAASPTMARLRAERGAAAGGDIVSTMRELTLPAAPVATPTRAGGLIP